VSCKNGQSDPELKWLKGCITNFSFRSFVSSVMLKSVHSFTSIYRKPRRTHRELVGRRVAFFRSAAAATSSSARRRTAVVHPLQYLVYFATRRHRSLLSTLLPLSTSGGISAHAVVHRLTTILDLYVIREEHVPAVGEQTSLRHRSGQTNRLGRVFDSETTPSSGVA